MRREPGRTEKESVEYFERLGIEVILTGTKSDKLNSSERKKAMKNLSVFFDRPEELIPVTSSSKKDGRDVLLNIISSRI
ncbi:hypothetical protein K7I13_04605 [Brucepastera parasyntrophica]|uniref:hypothetical protein n=1 Tax=Brucepastera parasyntrophica TaxID=2880008 RepID=UPI00210B2796|nr:hypothetical protein [Brucepastera parasyntrophica]ULQ60573.1 hypothetical protein K7I13_04605 [Brucepastera parasyntrophica]